MRGMMSMLLGVSSRLIQVSADKVNIMAPDRLLAVGKSRWRADDEINFFFFIAAHLSWRLAVRVGNFHRAIIAGGSDPRIS